MTTPNTPTTRQTPDAEAVLTANKELVRILTNALRRLGEAGHPDEANTFAGQAWSAVRHTDDGAARRINGMMHYLAGLPGNTKVEVPPGATD